MFGDLRPQSHMSFPRIVQYDLRQVLGRPGASQDRVYDKCLYTVSPSAIAMVSVVHAGAARNDFCGGNAIALEFTARDAWNIGGRDKIHTIIGPEGPE